MSASAPAATASDPSAGARRVELALEASGLGVWEWNLADGRVEWSEVLERIHGIPPRSFGGTLDHHHHSVHPDDRPRVADALRRAIDERTEPAISHRIVRADGQVRWLDIRGRLLLDASGAPSGVLGVCRDITDEHGDRLAQDRVAHREARHAALRADVSAALADTRDVRASVQRCCEALVAHLGVAFARLWTVDDAGTTLLLQASAGMYTHIDGGHAAVPVGKFKIGLIAEERSPHLTNDVPHDPRVGNPAWAAQERMVAFAGYPLLVDGRLIGVLAMFSREALHEETLGALGSIADLIAQGIVRRRTEIELEHRVDELARSNADLEHFAYVASHDLQEPLRMIGSYVQLLARRYRGRLDQDADEFIAFAVEGVSRMRRLIDDLLAYSRVGTRGNDLEQVDLEPLFETTLADLGEAIVEAGAQITHDPLPVVAGDRQQLGQILLNLVGNAIKFRDDAPPRVHVGARRDAAGWTISVRDNGIGIEPQYFERVFVIFQRLHPREQYPGTGIGLAIAKKIVERHGGRIWVESEPGSGATVSFTLPDTRSRRQL
jgi:PAS domain S-box-containing protein